MARHALDYDVMNTARKYDVNESTIRNVKKHMFDKVLNPYIESVRNALPLAQLNQ